MRIQTVLAGLAERVRFATAFLLLLGSAQLYWAADPGPPKEGGQEVATSPSQSSTEEHGSGAPPLAQMAEEILGPLDSFEHILQQ